MIEMLLALLVSIGIAERMPENTADAREEVIDENRPTEDEMRCFIECFSYCVWPSHP